MDNNFEEEVNLMDPIDPGEFVISKNHLVARDNYSILPTEAYAMPSNTYVPGDSHTFFVSSDKTMCWGNHGRCWKNEGDRVLVASQNSYKEWLLEFCPPEDYDKCGIIFGYTGVCHNYANRELLIGEHDVSVKDAPKNFVTVSIFGKYGVGLNNLKTLIKDSFTRANDKVMMTQDMLDTVLARIDNTLEDETDAWQQLINEYFLINVLEIAKEHGDALEKLKNMTAVLIEGREKLYDEHLNKPEIPEIEFNKYYDGMGKLVSTNLYDYINFLHNSNYINDNQYNIAKQNVAQFVEKIFGIVEGQMQAVQATGELNQELAKDKFFM